MSNITVTISKERKFKNDVRTSSFSVDDGAGSRPIDTNSRQTQIDKVLEAVRKELEYLYD